MCNSSSYRWEAILWLEMLLTTDPLQRGLSPSLTTMPREDILGPKPLYTLMPPFMHVFLATQISHTAESGRPEMRMWMGKHSPVAITSSDLEGDSLHSVGHM